MFSKIYCKLLLCANFTKLIVTTPFADDFNIRTRSKSMQQNLISHIEEKLEFMGLVVKPEKCQSLSIIKGKVRKEKFILRPEYRN